MYEERKEKFSFKSFFLTILVVLLFTFLMLWLFPTKTYITDKAQTGTFDINRIEFLYGEVFANNVDRMKDAAIGYYTNERMPQTVGQTKKLTLQEMYDLHLVLKMKDMDGNACSVSKSYVEMTKYTEEYRLKVNLSCGDVEDYIIVYLGCYNYCNDGICEKTTSTPSEKTKEEEKKDEPSVPNIPSTPTKKKMYEYKLETKESTTCTAWSNWQKDPIKSSASVSVETKTENEIVGYDTTKVQTGTKQETTVKKVTEKYVSGYTTKLVKVGTKEVQIGTTTKTVTEKVAVGTVEVYSGIGSGTKVPANTSTKHYKVISTDKATSCSYCETETKYTWEIYDVETVYDVVTKTITVPVYKTIDVYEEKVVPVYDFRTVEKEEVTEIPVYGEKQVPKYGNVTYYRSKTCNKVPGKLDVKWSYNKQDRNLLDKGYKLTGNVKEV